MEGEGGEVYTGGRRGWMWGLDVGEGERKRGKCYRNPSHLLWCQILRIVSTLLASGPQSPELRCVCVCVCVCVCDSEIYNFRDIWK